MSKRHSITGYNDMPFADHFNPPLTTLRIPHDQIGVQSSLLLLRMMRDPKIVVPSMQSGASPRGRASTADSEIALRIGPDCNSADENGITVQTFARGGKSG